ncbi:hypothetical protein ABEB36_010945 [Hypothenemus hampei]|uniref:[Histone H3]-lysine(4) N-trimethyltransferase n=1 Tax=Hypothenemus hampei TaxID=57062 RepID=A0ABD1EEA4_HYPHA
MGRSKFPGKPSKQCHRKRVNVLPPTGELNQEGQSSSVPVTGASKESKQEEDLSENEGESSPQTRRARPLRRRLSRRLSTTMRKTVRQRNFITKIRGKTAIKTNGRVSKSNLTKGHVCKDTNNFAGKFVLPTRSVHSSRVIKPNKRFIDINDTLNIKKKGLVKRTIKHLEDKGSTSSADTNDKLAFSNGHRVILRQARLKLPNQASTQGPFSSNLHNGPGTIVCGVCGAVRYYRFVKQARKFNIYSCESCRKFISQQIKRQSVGSGNSNFLICLTGQGTCYVPPVERTQHWKMSKRAYRSRCPACWLKMCLKSYHLPTSLKQNLTQLLPKNMRGIDFSFSSSLPPILWQNNTDTCESAKERPLRVKPLQKLSIGIPPPAAPDVKRQKIDLKGPRVKHVCRSASIVLGQPLATFEAVDNGDSGSKKTSSESQELKVQESSDAIKTNDPCISISGEEDNPVRIFYEKPHLPKKERSLNSPILSNKEKTDSPPLPPKGILLEQPHDVNFENRFKSGFSVTISEPPSTSAMCFLCGSAGFDDILACNLCCEIYHVFCLQEYGVPISSKDWICMRCSPCQKCKLTDKNKKSCSKCLRIYHSECFSSAEDANKLVCKDCTVCKECNAQNYNFSTCPGNLSLCLNCSEKRKIGKCCLICQQSFEESSFCDKILECSECHKWVHSDCEKLTSEQYDILKLLPVSSSFTCTRCRKDSKSIWENYVQTHLYTCFNRIFRMLTKNKSAKMVLKKLSIKGSLFRRYVLSKSLDIDNNNYNKDVDKIYSFEESERLKEPNITVYTLVDIKSRLWDYNSVKKFNNDMQEALKLYDSEQIMSIYKNIFQTVFPWFNQTHEQCEDPGLPCPLEVQEGSLKFSDLPVNNSTNLRCCQLCQKLGDGLSHQESRLLYCGSNLWVHGNCAYWSSNVYEQVDNHLQNVLSTIANSKNVRCLICDKTGASIQCHLCRSSSYHFMCARKSNFYFTKVGKTCFCVKHPPEQSEHFLKSDRDFYLNRSLFVDHSTKENLRCKPDKISCLIGSLCVKSLGKIEPVVSDTADAIIPTKFVCTKLFWSISQPWKLVTYTISTSIQNPNCTTLTVDKNFTVDHSLEQEPLEKAMKELNDWRRVYDRKPDDIDSEDEEEKNGTQLLSPELTDTILEDLPHDILDGISVQDIFPNFSYEDMLNLDNSNTDSLAESIKKPEEDDSTNDWLKYKTSEIRKVPPLSLTVSYKVEQNKKRKLSKESNNLLLLQLDGAFDESSSECGSPTTTHNVWNVCEEPPVTCEKCHCTYRTQASYKRHLDSCEVICTSESDSENVIEQESIEENGLVHAQMQPIEVTLQVSEPSQPPVLIQAFESYQSQVHTSVLNMESASAQPQVPVQSALALSEPTPISIQVPLCVGPQIVQPSIEFQQQQTQPMALQSMSQVFVQRSPRRDPMVLQQIQPAPTGFVPFVDAFGQAQNNQNTVQYVQLAPQVPTQPQLLQIRPDGNVIGILPSIQPPTVIVQQPQQLVLDSSGAFGWAQQPQPQIYYGFETIVQNTVMQSQQFLPTPVPGVLTANSSYSTTTQVFQTSKLEPVLDVSSNSFVLVNSSGQLEMPQTQFPQAQPIVTSQTPTLIYSTPASNGQKSIAATSQQNCINLPTAPFVSDHNIPMNVVPPIPKVPTSHARPMSRVLPMPTGKASKKIAEAIKFPDVEKPVKMDDTAMISSDLENTTHSSLFNSKKNRKFEILDYKIIKAPTTKVFNALTSVVEKPFKEFEPVRKLSRLSTYEPLKEIEKVKIENVFVKPLMETDKWITVEKRPKIENIPDLDQINKLEDINNEHILTENSLKKLEETIQKHNLQYPIKTNNKKSEDSLHKNSQDPIIKKLFQEPAKPSLDMPQLDDDLKEPPIVVEPLQTPCIKIESPIKNNVNKMVVPPLLSVKPQVKKLEDLPEPKQKQEPERNAAPSIVYTVENQEESFKCSSTSIAECWVKVLEAVQNARAAHNMSPLTSDGRQIKSVQITGLKSSHVKYLVEQLPGASKCIKYKPLFKFGPHSQDMDLCLHGFGSVRCQPYKTRNVEPYDMFNWLSSKHRKPFVSCEYHTVQSRRMNNFPITMKFKNLKFTSKYSVGVYRSKIHGKGLFCLRDIESGEMVIEYAGEVIRSILTDKREKFYNSKGIGCYMFRVDDNFVVDATMKGNAARFINHSCDPNCYSKVVEIMGHKHIIIFALRRISSGEELTYDYKFPFEEDKIPCTCGARRCRKFLN